MYEEKCANCGAVVETYESTDDGYENRTTNRRVLIPHRDMTIEAPEANFWETVCQPCMQKEPSLTDLLRKKRLEWYSDKIKTCDNLAESKKSQIKEAKKNIVQLKNAKAVFQELKKQIENNQQVDADKIPKIKELRL
jgi:hypothetical protein